MYFSVEVQQKSSREWQARVAELPGAVGTGTGRALALLNAQANARRILTLHLDSERAHPNRRRFLSSILGAAFLSASLASGPEADSGGKNAGLPGPETRSEQRVSSPATLSPGAMEIHS